MKALVVTNKFGTYEKGAHITDQAEIDKVLKSHHSGHVVTIILPDQAPPKSE
jgi:hypothetical protein